MSVRPADESGFDRDTALVAAADGELQGLISEAWRAAGGPHGGYVAALILRGLMMTVDDAARTPLTMTTQFVREPAFGPVQLQATVERTGRSSTSLSGRLVQGGSAVALVLASFGVEMPGPEYGELPVPEVEAPWEDRRSLIPEQAPRFVRNLVIQPRSRSWRGVECRGVRIMALRCQILEVGVAGCGLGWRGCCLHFRSHVGKSQRLADVAVEQVDVCFQREARAVMAQPYLNLLCVSPLGEQH